MPEVDVAVQFLTTEVVELDFAVGNAQRNGTTKVWLSGEFDIAGVSRFEQELQYVRWQGRRIDVIDLSSLVFIDAAGVHALVGARERMSTNGSSPTLIDAPPPVARVFELLGLTHLLAQGR
jgi:anti-anti-sigma factor